MPLDAWAKGPQEPAWLMAATPPPQPPAPALWRWAAVDHSCSSETPPTAYFRSTSSRSCWRSFRIASRRLEGLRAENAAILRSSLLSSSLPRRLMNDSRAGALLATISASYAQPFVSALRGMRQRWLSSHSGPVQEAQRRSVFSQPAASARLAVRHCVQM